MSKDLFSQQASTYAKYRPTYPAELIDYILSLTPGRQTAWDCATGNGQAALLLAPHFEKVLATDTSEKQLQQAVPATNIQYSVSAAEQTAFPGQSFDLIAVAQAYHWFRFDTFAKEVKRVARPGAILAVWGYNIPQSGNAPIDSLVREFYTNTVGSYWDAERKYVDDYYRSIPFPYDELPSKTFSIHVSWQQDDLPGYLNSWSSVQHFIKANGYNPVDAFAARLSALWPATKNASLSFAFPVFMRTGRIGA